MVLKSVIYALATCFLLSHIHAATKKNVVKTIKTEDGDIYDCVDFYKQPALNHPLLKSHTFHPQMRPKSRPKAMGNKKLSSMNEPPLDLIRLKDGGCPKGTVPIERLSQKEKTLKTQHSGVDSSTLNGGVIVDKPTFAIGQTKNDPSQRYFGVTGTLSVYNPRAGLDQYSSAEVFLKGGSDVLKAGWTVNPSAYKDNLTRSFIYTVAGNLSCFNSECGFVLVRSDIPLNFKLHPVTKRGGKVYTYDYYIYQDTKNGNYWLEISEWRLILGFWPQIIFQGLYNGGTYAACGGEVNSKASLPPPEMGAGTDPSYRPNPRQDSFCRDFAVLDGNYEFVDVDTEEYHNNNGYKVFDTHADHKHTIYFGGPV